MKHLKKTICLITAFIMAVSFASCSDKEADKEIPDSVPEETENTEVQEAESIEYKLTEYYEAAELSEFEGISGEIVSVAYAGDHMYIISDETSAVTGGYQMSDFDMVTLKKGSYYNAPSDYTLPEDTSSCTDPATGASVTVSSIPGAEKVFGFANGGVLYSNGTGVYLHNLKTGIPKLIEAADSSGLVIVDAFFSDKKYTVVYEQLPQMMEHFYVTDQKGKITEDTKMTIGYGGKISDVQVKTSGDMYFAKTSPAYEKDAKGQVVEYTVADVYRMKKDGTLNRVMYDEKLNTGYRFSDMSVADNGDIYLEMFNAEGQRIIQKYNQSGVMQSSVYFPEGLLCEKVFCAGDDLWIAYNDGGMISLAPLKDKTIDTASKIKTDSRSCRNIIPGDEKFDVYISDEYSLCGYKLSDGTHEDILEWTDADTDLYDTEFMCITEDEDIWCINEDGQFILKKADDARLAQLNSKRIITVAGDIYNDITGEHKSSDIYERIKEFNSSNDKYFIHAKDYMRYTTINPETQEVESGISRMWQEIEEGFSPDIVIYNPDYTELQPVIEKGLLADLIKLMDKDSAIEYDDIMENIADFCTVDGSIYGLFPTFRGSTVIQDEAYSDNAKMWSMNDFLKSVDPEQTGYRYNMEAFEAFLSAYINGYVDFENAECDFDSRAFKNLLEWAGEFDTAEEFEEALAWGAYDNVNPAYRPPVRTYDITDPWEFSREQAENYDDVVIKGWPSDEGVGMMIVPGLTFSVLESSGIKDISWDFISQFFTEEAYGFADDDTDEDVDSDEEDEDVDSDEEDEDVDSDEEDEDMDSDEEDDEDVDSDEDADKDTDSDEDTDKSADSDKVKPSVFSKPCADFMPVIESVMEKKIKDSISLKYEYEYYGEDYYPVWYDGGYETPVPDITKETEDKFRKAVYAPVIRDYRKSEIWTIITAEAEKYFADTEEGSANETAAEIQKKVSAYLTENYAAKTEEKEN